jgi:flagellum-specific peptidoglycan hydrolase FlgJ
LPGAFVQGGSARVLAKEFLFLKARVPGAIESHRLYGVPASITLAQAALESGWGLSQLSREAFNDFGIKAAQDASEYCELRTKEFINGIEKDVMAKFARYSSLADGFAHHALLLARSKRYAPAMAVAADAAKFADELQMCGYSTNPNYAAGLMQLVRQFNLTQYDTEPEPPAQAKEQAA